MTSVLQACSDIMWPKGKYFNLYLRLWLGCKFSGKESFAEVKGKLMPKVSSIEDYIDYIFKIQQLNFLIKVHERNYKYVTVSFNMSLDCFDKLNQSTFFGFEQEELFCAVEKRLLKINIL